MENPGEKIPLDAKVEYYSSYEVGAEGLEQLAAEFTTLTDSGLLDNDTLSDLRLVSFDSSNFYIITTGEHRSTEECQIERLSDNGAGWRIYQADHGGRLGKEKKDYLGAGAWLTDPIIEDTAYEARRVPNPKILNPTDGDRIVKAIKVPPRELFERIWQGQFDHLTDLVFHETAHIEEMLIRPWPNKGEISPFPSPKQAEEFVDMIRAFALGQSVADRLLQDIDRAVVGEMYAFMIDREAKRRFRPDRLLINDLNEGLVFESVHDRGQALAQLLEVGLTNYNERKRVIQKLLGGQVEE